MNSGSYTEARASQTLRLSATDKERVQASRTDHHSLEVLCGVAASGAPASAKLLRAQIALHQSLKTDDGIEAASIDTSILPMGALRGLHSPDTQAKLWNLAKSST